MKISCALLLSLLASCLQAEETETKVRFQELPEVVQRAASEQSKGATVQGYEKEIENGHTFYEVELKSGGKNKDVLLDETGKVVEVEQEIDEADVPPAALAAIRKQSAGAKIVKIESVTKDQQVSYEATISKGSKKSEIAVGADGSAVKP